MPLPDNAHTLVIGISTYRKVNQLPASVGQDAQVVYPVLIDPGYCSYPPQNVHLLLDEELTQAGISQDWST